MRGALFFLLFLCLLPCSWARAEYAEGIAMYGQPKYPPGFDHLGYVNPDAPKGGALRRAALGSFNSLNNVIITGDNKAAGLEYIDDSLMERAWDEPFTMYGLVAESIDVAPDRSWITFHLNKAARFHDGVPMTAADVKYSFDVYRKYGHPVRRRVYNLVKNVELIDDHDIKFTFGPGFDHETVMILAMMPVLPKHYWEKNDITKTTLKPPLGSGPYKIAFVDPGRKIVYARVKDYWAKDLPVNKGRYNVDTLSFTYYRNDDTSLLAFKAGDYDLRREYDIAKWETHYDFTALKEGKVVREETPKGVPDVLNAMIFNTRRPLFADRRVREALSMMFNADWVNKTLYFGKLRRIESAYPNSELAASGKPEGEELRLLSQYKDSLPPEVFGPAYTAPGDGSRDSKRKAIALLKEAGWKYRDGKLVNGKGEAFNFEILLGDPSFEKMILEFQHDLAGIGVTLRIRTVDSAQFTGRLNDYDYDMIICFWYSSLSPGNEQVNYWGIKSAGNKGARNYAGITDKAVDALADSIGRSTTREELVARCRALDRALMYGYYMIPLFYIGRDLVAHSANIHRPSTTPVYGLVLESLWYQAGDKPL